MAEVEQPDSTEVNGATGPIWCYGAGRHWQCTAHGRRGCPECKGKASPPALRPRKGQTSNGTPVLSAAGAHTATGELCCPQCGGTSFTARRAVGAYIAVGLLAPKSQVKCVTCGKVFKRG